MSREKFLQAREHIQAKQYDEARTILQTINHPMAQHWLNRLDKLAPEAAISQSEIVPPSSSRSRIVAAGDLLVIAVVLVSAAILLVNNQTSAIPTSDKPGALGLERYFPEDTIFYGAIQIDSEQIALWDELLVGVNTQTSMLDTITPNEQVNFTSYSTLVLQQLVSPDMSFDEDIRPWLGNRLAAGGFFTGLDIPDSDAIVVLEITDKQMALDFITKVFDSPNLAVKYEQGQTKDFTILHPTLETTPSQFTVLINNDALIFAQNQTAIDFIVNRNTPSLNDSPVFWETIQQLPAETYQAFGYMNMSAILNGVERASLNTPHNQPDEVTNELLTIDAQQILGFSILNAQTFVVDYATNIRDMSALSDLGYNLQGTSAIDKNFLAHIPEDAALVIQGTDIATIYQLLTDMGQATSVTLGGMLSANNLNQMELVFGGLTGIDLQNDLLSWLTGEYALFLSYDALPPGTPSLLLSEYFPNQKFDLNIQAGLLVEVTDLAKAQNFVEKLATSSSLLAGIETHRETLLGTNALILSVPHEQLNDPIEIIITANDTLFIVATREATIEILNGQGDFNQTSTFVNSEINFLDNDTFLIFANSNMVNLWGDAFINLGIIMGRTFANTFAELDQENTLETQLDFSITEDDLVRLAEMQQQIRSEAQLLEGFSITFTADSNSNTKVRYAVQLKEPINNE